MRGDCGLLGKTLVTYQTGPDGQKVSRLLVEEGLAIDRELPSELRRAIERLLWVFPVYRTYGTGDAAPASDAAIRGAVRADFFWGFGEEAAREAGRMRQRLRMWVLWPAGQPLPSTSP